MKRSLTVYGLLLVTCCIGVVIFLRLGEHKQDFFQQIGLQGNDPVSYFNSDVPLKGSYHYKSLYNGVTYHFNSAENCSLFNQNPSQYVPQYDGFCAYGLSILNKETGAPEKWRADPNSYKVIDNKLYLFYKWEDYDARQLWEEQSEPEAIRRADSMYRMYRMQEEAIELVKVRNQKRLV